MSKHDKLEPPPENTTCDAYIGITKDKWGTPQVIRCTNIATETRIGFPAENWLCKSCAEILDKKKK